MKAKFIDEVTVIDPDSKGEVQISVFKHENGGMFAIDSSFLDQCTDDDDIVKIPDPLNIKPIDSLYDGVEYLAQDIEWLELEGI